MSYSSSNMRVVDNNLVEKILEQGQKLRNAMIGSILKNDPLSTEIIYNNHFNTPRSSRSELRDSPKIENFKLLNDERLDAFIRGDCMTKEEEKLALNTLQSLSASDLCETTERSLKSTNIGSCKCYICKVYNSNYFARDSKLKNQTGTDYRHRQKKVTRNVQEKYRDDGTQTLEFVDSLKIAVNSLVLNDTGNQRVLASVNDKKVPCNVSPNFFLEYKLPDSLVDNFKHKSKVDSGLENNQVRLSSRKTSNIINFKQVTIHDIKSLDKVNLANCDMQFKVSFRNCKQKNSVVLGYARFNFEEFVLTKNLSCSRGLVVFLNQNSPIAVGVLKLSLQLGCGRLYFGQEFIDAIISSNKDTVLLDSDDSTNQLLSERTHHAKPENEGNDNSVEEQTDQINLNSAKHLLKDYKRSEHGSHSSRIVEKPKPIPVQKTEQTPAKKASEKLPAEITVERKPVEAEKDVLFSFFYISEAQYLSGAFNSFFTCQPFSQTVTSVSPVVANTSNPIFNFHQVVPLVFEDDLLLRLRENYMIIEFWRKSESTSTVVGISKVSLHQFYLAYRNSVILKYLAKNKLPVIGTDWWEPIYSPDKEDLIGQVQILTALGTEEQINNLKSDRGFPSSFVRANYPDHKTAPSKPLDRLKSGSEKPRSKPLTTFKKPEKILPVYREKSTNTSVEVLEKSDAATQSIDNMENNNGSAERQNSAQDVFGSFLEQLLKERQRNVCVENSTNTEAVQERRTGDSQLEQAQSKTNTELRRTTDLLDSLQNALSSGNRAKPASSSPDSFKATVSINSANHLPSRKKCKSRRSRCRSYKHEENILPSCYVSFETLSEDDVKITPIIPKSTSPVWNYKSDVRLPLGLLLNNQKRLIFKVWKLAQSGLNSPNMQADTVLGFAALDLTVLLAGFPNIQGWFNIVDFSGKCHGQINVHVTPLEDLTRFRTHKALASDTKTAPPNPETLLNEPFDTLFKKTSETLFNKPSETLFKNPSETLSNEHSETLLNEPPETLLNEPPETLFNEPSETLSRVLKRKFTELDEITQRLRFRLSSVTNDDSDASSNGFAEEFERDINTLCIEEDFDLVDFDEEARKLNLERSDEDMEASRGSGVDLHSLLRTAADEGGELMMVESGRDGGDSSGDLESVSQISAGNVAEEESRRVGEDSTTMQKSSFDKHLLEGKKHINTLLEKLTLLSVETGQPFANRYVSGCSFSNENNADIDTEAMLEELDHTSRPNIQSSWGLNPSRFEQLYGESARLGSANSSKSSSPLTATTDTSLITDFSDRRAAPDGHGNTSDANILRGKE